METDGFAARCEQAARAFVRTVAVVDDNPEWDVRRADSPTKVETPLAVRRPPVGGAAESNPVKWVPPDRPIVRPTASAAAPSELDSTPSGPDLPRQSGAPTDSQTPSGGMESAAPAEAAPKEDESHVLQTQKLAEAFADNGLVCSILVSPRLDRTTEVTWKERVKHLAARVDVLVLDWSWNGDPGTFCLSVIESIRDAQTDRRQLVVIYTGSDDEQTIADGLTRLKGTPETQDRLTFRWPTGLDVVVLQKPRAKLAFGDDSRVDEAELPARIIREFGRLSGGLLANAAMHAFEAVRDRTHRILGEFDRSLDAAYVVHRAYTVPRDGAQDQVLDLLGDALSDLIREMPIADHLSDERVNDWLDSGHVTPRHDAVKSALGGQPVTNLAIGADALPKRGGSTSIKRSDKMVTISDALSGTTDGSGRRPHLQFGKLVYMASTAATGRPPKLCSGVVVRTGDEYLVCIMPLCDAERVPAAGQVFPFLRAVEGRDNEHRNVVVTDEGGSGSLLELYIPVAMPHLVLAEFRPEADKQPVRAKGGDGSPFLFESSNQSAVYRYVARLRPMVAQEIAAGLAAAGARVGLMHSEYARR